MQIFVANKKGKDILQEDMEMREILNEFDVDTTDEQQYGLFGQLLSVELGRLSKIKQGREDSNEN